MKEVWRRIKAGAKIVGDFQARVLLSFLYVLLVLPTGLITKISGDLLESRYPTQTLSFWKVRRRVPATLKPARRQA